MRCEGSCNLKVLAAKNMGYTKTSVNEKVFTLPKPLKSYAVINIKGTMPDKKEKIIFTLKSDIASQNNEDYVLQMVIDFSEDTLTMIKTINENCHKSENLGQKPSQILPTSDFMLEFTVADEDSNINIKIGMFDFGQFTLGRHTLQNIGCFSLSNDVIEVEKCIAWLDLQ